MFFTAEPVNDYVDAALVSVLQIHKKEPLPVFTFIFCVCVFFSPQIILCFINIFLPIHSKKGDILVFLTGQEEIDSMEKILKECVER